MAAMQRDAPRGAGCAALLSALGSRTPARGGVSSVAHLLPEAVLGAARQVLLVAHAAGAAVLPPDHLLAPVVVTVAGRRVAAAGAHLLLDVEGGATAAAAASVGLLDLLLQGLLGVRHLGSAGRRDARERGGRDPWGQTREEGAAKQQHAIIASGQDDS